MEVDPPPCGRAGGRSLNRFIEAQSNGVYDRALREIRGGQKTSHWMWFIFPQLDGLGSSSTARYYAIKDLSEAEAYLEHPILGPRLRECAEAVLNTPARSAHEMLGSPDDLKLRSSVTLFAQVAEKGSVFERVLTRFFGGEPDRGTIELLARQSGDRAR